MANRTRCSGTFPFFLDGEVVRGPTQGAGHDGRSRPEDPCVPCHNPGYSYNP
jgi:hypothetical protein